jgi:hypothetical protein
MARMDGRGVAGREGTVHQKPAAWTRLNSSTVTSSPYTHGVPAWAGDRSQAKYQAPRTMFMAIKPATSLGLFARIDGGDTWS